MEPGPFLILLPEIEDPYQNIAPEPMPVGPLESPIHQPSRDQPSSPRPHFPLIPSSALFFVRELGKGSFGEVRLAWWTDGDSRRSVAVKANGLQCASAEAIDNEIKLHQVLLGRPHHNVVTVLGVCVDSPDGNVRLVMEYYSGGSLDSHLHRVRESGEVSLMSRSRAVHGAPDVTAVKL